MKSTKLSARQTDMILALAGGLILTYGVVPGYEGDGHYRPRLAPLLRTLESLYSQRLIERDHTVTHGALEYRLTSLGKLAAQQIAF